MTKQKISQGRSFIFVEFLLLTFPAFIPRARVSPSWHKDTTSLRDEPYGPYNSTYSRAHLKMWLRLFARKTTQCRSSSLISVMTFTAAVVFCNPFFVGETKQWKVGWDVVTFASVYLGRFAGGSRCQNKLIEAKNKYRWGDAGIIEMSRICIPPRVGARVILRRTPHNKVSLRAFKITKRQQYQKTIRIYTTNRFCDKI